MNSWFVLRRLRGPALIILVGVTALLDQWGILRFSRSWPLYLILAGIFGLLERALLDGAPVPPPYHGVYPDAYAAPGYSQTVSGPPAVIDAPADAERRL